MPLSLPSSMRALISRLQRDLQRVRDLFPLTARGVLIAAIAGVALRDLAYGALDFVVLVFGYAALLLIALCLPLTVLGSFYLARRLPQSVEPLRIVAGRFLPSDFRQPNLRYFPLVEVEVLMDEAGFERREVRSDEGVREEIRARHRGLHDAVGRQFRVRDAFGLTEITLRRRLGEVFVLPDPGRYEPSLDLISATLGDEHSEPFGAPEGDRIDLRRYHPGDPARFIHWKIYARTGELMLRSPEIAVQRADRIALYLVAGPGDEAASALALTLVKALSHDERIVFGVDGTPGLIHGAERAARAIASSRGYEGPTELSRFLDEAEQEGPVALVVLTPQRTGAWLDSLEAALRARHGAARAIIGVDGMNGRPRSFLRRVFFRDMELEGQASTRDLARELDEVERRLRAQFTEVFIADRANGSIVRSPSTHGRREAA